MFSLGGGGKVYAGIGAPTGVSGDVTKHNLPTMLVWCSCVSFMPPASPLVCAGLNTSVGELWLS